MPMPAASSTTPITTGTRTDAPVDAKPPGFFGCGAGGASLVLSVTPESLQTQRISSVSFFVPSILAMALMQLGIFAAIPLVQQREKLILKRLNATPLPRWTPVASTVVVRLIIAALQTILILGIGMSVLGVQVSGNWPVIAGFVALGALVSPLVGLGGEHSAVVPALVMTVASGLGFAASRLGLRR